MFNRREFTALAAGAALFPASARAAAAVTPFYASIGPVLTRYDLDVENATLTVRETTQLPSALQYAWPSPSRRFLYAVTSRDPMGALKTSLGGHSGMAFRIDSTTGALTPHGPSVALPQRPIHMSMDRSGRFMLTAYNTPSRITVHRIGEDGTLGDEVPQSDTLDLGMYAHQVRATPDNHTVTLVNLGDPGALRVLGFEDGKLRNIQVTAPDGIGKGYGPRHLDFDPKGRFVYVSLQKNNRMDVYGLKPDGTLTADTIFRKNCLSDTANGRLVSQGPGGIHAHPNGRIVYVANRSSKTIDFQGKQVYVGGENNIAVFSIDQNTGEPTLIQTADTQMVEPRTFVMDPSSRVMVAHSQMSLPTREGGVITSGLTLFRVAPDGKLTFVRKYETDTSKALALWCGSLTMA